MSVTGQNPCILTSPVVRSDSLKRVMKLVEQVARHPAAVLIVGETGTGKEMVARSIHNCSLRCNNPWVDVNCAAIPEHLVESELFGYEKGAFSGADTMKPGLFEMADKGTLFLDEIGDLDLKIQVKLLRVLDGISYYRLGGSKKVGVDVRVVAATNQDLEMLVKAGRFRSDLYHRLAQFKLELPPLRERPEDLLGVAEQLLQEHYPESRFTSDAVRAMFAYGWPGNVRELKNSVFHAVMVAKNPQVQISAADLELPDVSISNGNGSGSGATAVPVGADLNQVERQMIFQALERFGGNQGKAAQALGISRRTLIRKLKAYREAVSEEAIGTLQVEQQRLRCRHRAQSQHNLGSQLVDGAVIAQECVVRVDHQPSIVCAATQPRERIGQDRVAQPLGETRHRRRQLRIVLRPAHEQPPWAVLQVLGEAIDQLITWRQTAM